MIEGPPNARDADPWHWKAEDAVLCILVGLLLLVSFSQIISRNVFETTALWAEPLVRHLVLWSSFLGALIACREGKHISIDAFVRILPERMSRAAASVNSFICGVVCTILTWIAGRFVVDERAFQTVAFLDVPNWILQVVFPVVFGLMALRFFDSGMREVSALVRSTGQK